MAMAVPTAMAALSSLHSTGLVASSSSRQTRCGSSSVLPTPVLCIANARKTNVERSESHQDLPAAINRREAMGLCGLGATLSLLPCIDRTAANAVGLPEEEKPRLCDANCEKDLENIPTQTTPSGLQYKDILVGRGPSPPKGFQVQDYFPASFSSCSLRSPDKRDEQLNSNMHRCPQCGEVAANYVAMIPTGKVFDSSLEKGLPYIFRVGADQVIKGLDEGISSMKVGGKRRLYIPGELAFPKGLTAAAGRPRVPPSSPVVFDVNLLYVPGLEDEFEDDLPTLSSSDSSSDEGDSSEEDTPSTSL